jgi:hypothetical protein
LVARENASYHTLDLLTVEDPFVSFELSTMKGGGMRLRDDKKKLWVIGYAGQPDAQGVYGQLVVAVVEQARSLAEAVTIANAANASALKRVFGVSGEHFRLQVEDKSRTALLIVS